MTMNAEDARDIAAAAPPDLDVAPEDIDLSDIPETNFAQPGAVRGKYKARFYAASGLAKIAPDLRDAFPDDEAVNRALRHVLELAKDGRGL
jgi:hypothetical protein